MFSPCIHRSKCVRYCFDGAGEDCRPGTHGPDDPDSEPQSPDITPSHQNDPFAREANAPPHLPHPNSWFAPGLSGDSHRYPRLTSARTSRHVNTPAGGRSSWRGEGDDDPGFFVTSKVTQPADEDVLSWDSCSSSTSEEDVRDIVIDGTNNNYLWGSVKPPIPPRARNLSANKTFEDQRMSSFGGSHISKKVENTFRLEPKQEQVFVWFKAKRPIVNIVDQLMNDFVYNVKTGPAVTRKLCDVIMKMIKKTFDWPRYKFVCNVTLIQLKGQGVMIADRSLWNTSFDNVASYVYKNKFLVCVVTFHALYFE